MFENFSKYRKGLPGSQVLAAAVFNTLIESGIELTESATSGAIVSRPNAVVVETIHTRRAVLTVSLYGPPDDYSTRGFHRFLVRARKGYARARFTAGDLDAAVAMTRMAIAFKRKACKG